MNDHKNRLDALIRDAKQDLTPRLDDDQWSAIEERILARMEREGERKALVDEVRASSSRRARIVQIGALILAAAAAVAFVVNDPGHDPGGRLDGNAAPSADLTASSLRGSEGEGEIRVGGLAASAGHVLREGDVLEAEGARALLERPRKVAWLLERGAAEGANGARVGRARVKSAGESLVLGLEDGAIEAQVTPVPSGEAFAVDIAAGASLVRVAVHGTHLRVSRAGSRVVVDLTEGVVSIGVPPRTGSTYGTLVTAPSHVEFDAADLDHTLRIDHAPAAVRTPVALAFHDTIATGIGVRAAEAPQAPAADVIPAAAADAVATVPRPAALARPVADPSRTDTAAKVDPKRSGDRLGSREALARAVRDCASAAARSRPANVQNVQVTVTSSLKLKIAAGGDVETAQFDPPLLPEIQTCAATAIYKAKLEESAGGSVTIPIAFSY